MEAAESFFLDKESPCSPSFFNRSFLSTTDTAPEYFPTKSQSQLYFFYREFDAFPREQIQGATSARNHEKPVYLPVSGREFNTKKRLARTDIPSTQPKIVILPSACTTLYLKIVITSNGIAILCLAFPQLLEDITPRAI
ncbi:MAG TPA: hypothetical protein VFT64_06350 [Rickettsiales bacterium]|nr:hypothetical protein [Rickettsiales bacterium]